MTPLLNNGCFAIEAEEMEEGINSLESLANQLREFSLSSTEIRLFLYLFNNSNRIVGRGDLLTNVWRGVESMSERAIDVAIFRLRRKISPKGYIILTVYGEGYRLYRP